MAKASELLQGRRAIMRVRLPLVNLGCSLLPDDVPELVEQRKKDEEAWKEEHPDEEVPSSPEVGLRVLLGSETADVLEGARRFARERGVENPKETDPEYELGRQVYTLLTACVDPDTCDGPGDPEPFFDSVEQILDSPHLGRDGICYLAEQHELWQDRCSPQALNISTDKLWEMLAEVKGPDGLRFFGQLRPGLRWSLVLFLANLLISLQMLSAASTSSDEKSGIASKSGPSSKKGRKTKASKKP